MGGEGKGEEGDVRECRGRNGRVARRWVFETVCVLDPVRWVKVTPPIVMTTYRFENDDGVLFNKIQFVQ